jgi:hypothetical protein
MVVDKTTNRFAKKGDFINIAILSAIALGVGIYLIATTVLIAKDGVFYIEQAQKFGSDPVGVIKGPPFGYPFLVFIAHKAVVFFSNSSSVYSWIYTAQAVNLLCRLLAIIALYFIGKVLVGSRNSFWAVLILIMLPYPARFGSDVLREWPHILFLSAGFLFLICAAKQGKWWMFGLTGLASGAGHIIRPECAQFIVYGVLWLLIRLLLPKHNIMNRPKMICALFVLIVGFAIPVVPYIKVRGKVLPPQLKALFSSSRRLESNSIQERKISSCNQVYVAASPPINIVKATGRLIEEISGNLMYFFVPALLIGIYSHFRKQSEATDIERFLVPAFITLNVTMMILLHYNWGYISRRHSLPLVVFTIFYVPIGLQVLGDWLDRRLVRDRLRAEPNPQLWFFVLLAVGIAICLPKLLRPMRIEKQGYRDAARWLEENTSREDIIAVPDRRISFYAERKGSVYSSKVPKQAKYIVRIAKNENEKLKFGRTVKEEYSVWVDKRKKSGKKLVIYRIM